MFKTFFFGEYRKFAIFHQIDELLKRAEKDFNEEEIKNFKMNVEKGILMINDNKLEFRLSPLELLLSKFGLGWIERKSAIWANNYNLANWKYGAFHSSLVLNGYIIEWDDSSLVIPQVDYSKLVHFSYEIKERLIWRIIGKIKNLLVIF